MSCDNVGGTRQFDNLFPVSDRIYVQISMRRDGRTGQYDATSYHICAYERLEKQEGEINHMRSAGHADVYIPPRTTIKSFFERVNQAVEDLRRKKQ